jgi:hypothetical protein
MPVIHPATVSADSYEKLDTSILAISPIHWYLVAYHIQETLYYRWLIACNLISTAG